MREKSGEKKGLRKQPFLEVYVTLPDQAASPKTETVIFAVTSACKSNTI